MLGDELPGAALWRIATTVALALCLITTACSSDSSSSGDQSETFSVLASLKQIPLSAAGDQTWAMTVSVADLDVVADQAGLTRPTDSTDGDQMVEFFGPLTGLQVGGKPMRLFIEMPELFDPPVLGNLQGFADEAGFSPNDITSFVSLQAGRNTFGVFDGVSINPSLNEVVPGVQTTREGEDFEAGSRTATHSIGFPLRMAERNGLVGLSLTTAAVVDWLDGPSGATLADEPMLARVAMRLDEETAASAVLRTFFDQPPPEPLRYDDVPDEPFTWGLPYDGAGVGWVAQDDARGIIVLAYPTEAEAQLQLAHVTAGFSEDVAELSRLLSLDSIEVRGSEIVATVRYSGEALPSVLSIMLNTGVGPFAPSE